LLCDRRKSISGRKLLCDCSVGCETEQTVFVADAHRGDEKRFIVRADEKLTAFLELESVTSQAPVRESASLSAANGIFSSTVRSLITSDATACG
jgi:hypothetical protein